MSEDRFDDMLLDDPSDPLICDVLKHLVSCFLLCL
jgi:hypothetical protein